MKIKELIEFLGDCDPKADIKMSIDISTCENTADDRMYGELFEATIMSDGNIILLCDEPFDNRGPK